jgi:hypothetical protein
VNIESDQVSGPQRWRRPSRVSLGLIVFVVSGLVALAAGIQAFTAGSSEHSSSPGPSSRTKQNPSTSATSTTAAPTTTLATPTTVDNGVRLHDMVLPAPSGFVIEDTPSDAPVDAVGFDVFMGSKTAAAGTGFIDGWHQSYESSHSEDTIEVSFFEFANPSDAVEFSTDYVRNYEFAVTPDGVLGHAQDYDSPGRSAADGIDHGIVMVKGSRALVVDYWGSTPTRPPLLATVAQEQSDRL